MKTVVVLRQEVVDLTCGNIDAQFAQLFEQQRLRDVALVILVQDEGDQIGAEVTAGRNVRRQRRQQRVASWGDNAFAPVVRTENVVGRSDSAAKALVGVVGVSPAEAGSLVAFLMGGK
jgi:hypothetical protein